MNDLENIKIENFIYEIDGKQVMLDRDVARLYEVETKRINEAVKNNPDKFPSRYVFRISEKYYFYLKSNFSTSNKRGGSRKGHTAFTEEGVAMLATILKSKIAIKVSIKIMDTFVAMRKFLNENKDIFKRITTIEYKMLEYDDNFEKLFDALEPKKLNTSKIFFNGEIYDSYSLIIDLIKEANNRIIIIDNYIDKSILDMLTYKNKNVEVLIVTGGHYIKIEIDKFSIQYPKLKIICLDIFHDRFLIVDNTLYHIGASLKDLGKKCFGISKIEDSEYLNKILSLVN